MKNDAAADKHEIRSLQDQLSSLQTTKDTLNNKIEYLEKELEKRDKLQEEDKERSKQWDKNYETL